MSREPTPGPRDKSSGAAGAQRGGQTLAAQSRLSEHRQSEHNAKHVPLGNQSDPSRVAPAVKLSPADFKADSAEVVAVPTTAQTPAAGDHRPGTVRTQALRPSRDGGVPALQRELGAHGRETVRRLLEAGLVEFEEAGFQAARVEDIVRRAKTSHGTFYLYFANKDDLFRTLLRDALVDMANITDEFPVVTSNDAGRATLRRWVTSFCDTYAVHATVIRLLSQAEIVGESVFSDGLQLFFRLSEVMTQGMTAAQTSPAGEGVTSEHAELTAVACLMMLERINYLMSAEVRLPREEMIDRLSAIIYAAFRS
jgi:AcrR family transcriptional regulator